LRRLEKSGAQIFIEKKHAREKLQGKSFVFTGTLSSMSRDDAKEKVRALGGETSESVSKKTSYVVVGENPGSKYKMAQKLGVTVLDGKEFLKIINLNRLIRTN